MQKPLFMLGWALLVATFVAAAFESVAPALGVRSWPLISAKDLWHTAYPAGYVLFKGSVEDISPFLWDPVLVSVLWFPAWALFLAPGAWLTLYFRPNRVLSPDEERELQRQRESLFLYDELLHAARHDETLADGGDDLEPSHFIVEDMYDKDELETWDTAEGEPPDTHDVFGNLDAPGTLDLTPGQAAPSAPDAPDALGGPDGGEYIQTAAPVFQVLPPDENAESEKPGDSEDSGNSGDSGDSEDKKKE
ncbi:MAG: hypothetical protein ACYYKD_02725 [Rhodospirillales bacterium]